MKGESILWGLLLGFAAFGAWVFFRALADLPPIICASIGGGCLQ